MDIQKLLVPYTCDSTSLTHGTMDVQGALILSTVHGQHNEEQHPYTERLASAAPPHEISTSSQSSVASDRHTSTAVRSVSARPDQCSTQIIMITDRQGHHVPILTDVSIGSKVANEKRRRNAVTSAKIRSNKSKEIASLQKELRDALECVKRVTAERDDLKLIVERNNTMLAQVHLKGL